MMKLVALVTDSAWPNLCKNNDAADHLLELALSRSGISVKVEIWDDDAVDWTTYDMVILRSTWDYSRKIGAFKSWLQKMKSANINLFNSVDTVLWNMDKNYLQDLAKFGVRIPKSVFCLDNNDGESFNISEIMKEQNFDKCIVKPTIGCDSVDIYFLESVQEAIEMQKEVEQTFSARNRSFIVQEYIEDIATSGEWSLIYFGQEFSHAIIAETNKTDFLVRGEPYNFECRKPPHAALDAGAKVMSYLADKKMADGVLYSRIDFVLRSKGKDSEVVLIEVELIEPSLYLACDLDSVERFQREILKRLKLV